MHTTKGRKLDKFKCCMDNILSKHHLMSVEEDSDRWKFFLLHPQFYIASWHWDLMKLQYWVVRETACSLYQHKPFQHVHALDSSSTTCLIWARLVFLAALIRDLIISQVCRNFELQTPFALKIHEGQGIVRAA